MVKKRIEWVDMAKAVAILFMIIGHELSGEARNFIFSFHMPLFFILSGYTSRKITSFEGFKNNVAKNFRRMWLFASLMVILMNLESWVLNPIPMDEFLLHLVKGIFWGSNILKYDVTNVGVVWFLYAFFWGKLIYDGICVLIKDWRIEGVIFLLEAAIAYLLARKELWLPQTLDIALVAAFFMWMGAVLKQVKFDEMKHEKWLLSLAFIYWIVCLTQGLSLDLSVRSYPKFLVTMLEALAGTLVWIKISKYFLLNQLTQKLSYFGKHTMVLLCIHHLDFYWIKWGGWLQSEYSQALLRTILDLTVFFIVMAIMKLRQKN